MQGVGERGRDCCLYMDGEIIGIVQCKKYNERITRPAILKEILKFIMHSIIDDDIYPYKLNNFYYIVFVSNDYTEPAMTLLKQFKGEIKKEDVEKYFNEIKNTYDSLKFLEYNLYKDKIESKLNNLSIENYNSHDLTLELQCYPQLIPAYFSVMNVISVEQNKEIIMECLEKFGLKYVTDLNLKNFEERIKNIPDENRINLGVVDFYGYNIDFIIKNKDLVMSIYKNLTMEKNKLDREILAYITNLINEKILQYITIPLLYEQKIHSYSLLFVPLYLQSVCSRNYLKQTMPTDFFNTSFEYLNKNNQKILETIEMNVFEITSCIFNNDNSTLIGPKEFIEERIYIYKQYLKEIESLEVAKTQYKQDKVIILSVLNKIENEINEKVKHSTILIKDFGFFENGDYMAKVKSDLKKISN